MTKHVRYLVALSRQAKVTLQIVADSAMIAVSFVAAMMILLPDRTYLANPGPWGALAVSVFAALGAFRVLGLYKALIRYVTGGILVVVAGGALVAAVLLYPVGRAFDAGLPGPVPAIFAVFLVLTVGGVRFVGRTLLRMPARGGVRRVIVYGAGDAGLQVVRSLEHGRDYLPVAFVDDDPAVQGLKIAGLKVHSPDHIAALAAQTGARLVLLAMPSVGRAQRRRILERLEGLHLKVRTIPGLSEIIAGQAQVSEMRPVAPEDLLGRDAMQPDPDLLARNVAGRVVMVSGAGGSIGSELCRQILPLGPSRLVLYEMSEHALYAIEAELSETAARLDRGTAIVAVLGSVQNRDRLDGTIRGLGVQTIYHAAAYKHVPLVEDNVVEGIRNNVFGTRAIAESARRHAVENFILVSTDKAVRPISVMGATKRIAELICQAHAAEQTSTVFSMVRFGNVMGSSGSVIPRFLAQIDGGGPVTVTHRDVSRYFMTIPEAAQLVIQAGALGRGGDVFVLDMGEPVRILDLALRMVRLQGLTPCLPGHQGEGLPESGDIAIRFTGLRRGEKLHEELLIGAEPSLTQHPRIMTASEPAMPMARLSMVLDRLMLACDKGDLTGIFAIMEDLPIDYSPAGPAASCAARHAARRQRAVDIVADRALAGLQSA